MTMIIICCGESLYGKKIYNVIVEKPETKTVCFSIAAGTDYSSSIYKKSKVKVHLSIYKFAGPDRELVWEGIVDEGKIQQYPTTAKQLYREVTVYNVFDSHETLAAYYEVEYNSKGSKISYSEGRRLSKGTSCDSLNISI